MPLGNGRACEIGPLLFTLPGADNLTVLVNDLFDCRHRVQILHIFSSVTVITVNIRILARHSTSQPQRTRPHLHRESIFCSRPSHVEWTSLTTVIPQKDHHQQIIQTETALQNNKV